MGVQVPPSAPLIEEMAHILVLKASDYEEITKVMLESIVEVITSNNHTYDEISVPSAKELPIAMNLYTETINYEGSVCIGTLENKYNFGLLKENAAEILRNLYEYSTYYAIPIGISVTYFEDIKNADLEEVSAFAHNIAYNTVSMMRTIRQLNSLESDKYAQYRKHN
jgi:6,7-dimethyl-8-ribityllumazine synthase